MALLTWFGGVTLYNRIHLKRRGMDQFPLPSFKLPSLSGLFGRTGSNASSGAPKSGFGWRRRSQRGGTAGYSNIRADEYDEGEGFAGRFSLDDDDDLDDQDAQNLTSQSVEARALAGEANAWRSQPAAGQGGAGSGGNAGRGLVDV